MFAVVGEDAGGIAIAALVNDVDRFVKAVSFHQRKHGAEDFLVRHSRIGLHIGDQRGTDPGTALVAVNAEIAPVHDDVRAFAFALPDHRFDAFFG